MRFLSAFSVLSVAETAWASPWPAPSPPPTAAVSVLHAFAYPSWAENLAFRPNGNILVTRFDTPEVWEVDVQTGDAVLVYAWNATEYLGNGAIAETTPDVFYVITAAFVNSQFEKTSGTNSVFKLDMKTFRRGCDADGDVVLSNATVSKLVDIPEADILNGMTTLDRSHILVSDIHLGTVYKVNTETAVYGVAVDDPKMKSSYVPSPAVDLGTNGIKIFDGHLYWTNTGAGFLARVPINAEGSATGQSSIAATNLTVADDFIIREDGVAFVAQNMVNTLAIAFLDARSSVQAYPIAGSNTSTVLAGVSAARFGNLPDDCTRLYLTTSGATGKPINGTVSVAGTVSYIETTQYQRW